MTIYIDEIFAVNLLMDGIVLWVTARLTQQTMVWWRLILAAITGACYAVLIFFPNCRWMAGGTAKAVCALLMILLSFKWRNWPTYIKTLIYLYLVSFAFGGATIALMYFFGERFVQTWNGIVLVQVNFKLFWLLAAVAGLLGIVSIMQKSLRQRLEQMARIVTVSAGIEDKTVRLQLLADSGNQLTDPTTGRSVVVAQLQYLRPLFTEAEYRQLQNYAITGEIDVTELILQLETLSGRIRLIPYQTVGYQGLLIGIRTDYLRVESNKEVIQPGIVLALSPHYFSTDGTYQGIISPALL